MELDPQEAIKLLQPQPVSVITTINQENVPNAAAFSWITPTSRKPPLISIMVSPDRYTHENLLNTKKFVINIITKHSLEETMYVGTKSFKEEPEKLEKSEFTTKESKMLKVPRIAEAIAWLECEVKNMWSVGDHTVVSGEILIAEVMKEFWKDRLLIEEAETLQHLGGNKFVVAGEYVEFK